MCVHGSGFSFKLNETSEPAMAFQFLNIQMFSGPVWAFALFTESRDEVCSNYAALDQFKQKTPQTFNVALENRIPMFVFITAQRRSLCALPSQVLHQDPRAQPRSSAAPGGRSRVPGALAAAEVVAVATSRRTARLLPVHAGVCNRTATRFID